MIASPLILRGEPLRKPNDFYPTPMSIVDRLLDELDWTGQIWEPCKGDGRVVAALLLRGHNVVGGDITTGQDFFQFQRPESVNLVTNPPFKTIRPFIDHAFKIGVQRMALVCPERLWACKVGREQFQRHKPTRFINMDWREDYLGKGGSPDRALAVSIWERPCAEKCSYEVWSK